MSKIDPKWLNFNQNDFYRDPSKKFALRIASGSGIIQTDSGIAVQKNTVNSANFSYDSSGKLTGINLVNINTYTGSYNSNNQLTGILNALISYSFVYNSSGLLTGISKV